MQEVRSELFFDPSLKQWEAWQYLTDKTTTEIGFGGGANGGKSYLGCKWICANCLTYPGTRWGIGRKQMTDLRLSTMKTLFKVFNEWGLVSRRDYRYIQKPNEIIIFPNGSEIIFISLAYMPSDPYFHRLGSLELTGAWVDESAECRSKAIQILRVRCGRCENKKYSLSPKLFETFNPDKGHVYFEFWKPWKNERDKKTPILPNYRKFVRSLITDNPHASENEIEQLRRSDKTTRERLLYGNFEYDDDPNSLFDRDTIDDLFTTVADPKTTTLEDGTIENKTYEKFISVDTARKGKDTTRIGIWHGLQLKRVVTISASDYKKSGKTPTQHNIDTLIDLEKLEKVRRSHVVIDEDGVGGGLVDGLSGCRGFINGSSPIEQRRRSKKDQNLKMNFLNLKTQCWFELARLAIEGKIGIDAKRINAETSEMIIEDLEQIKEADIDKDGKKKIIPKDIIKERLGRSPDLGDMMMMRMLFELKLKKVFLMSNLN